MPGARVHTRKKPAFVRLLYGFCTRKSGLQASCTTSYFVLKANNGCHDTREPYLAVRTPDSRDEVNKGEQTWQRKNCTGMKCKISLLGLIRGDTITQKKGAGLGELEVDVR